MPPLETVAVADTGQMPAVGLGLWKIEPAEVAAVIEQAASLGYRHFDSASDYGNEREAGDGFHRILDSGLCQRDELWVTSKLWNTNHAAEHVRPAIERTLRDLQLDYLDLYLIHFPISLAYIPPETRYPAGWFYDPAAAEPRMHPVAIPLQETWREMERLQQAGLTRHIGVCNFNVSLLRDLLSYAAIPPAVLQVELHPYLTQEKLLRFCRDQGIAVTAYSPLGAGSYVSLGMAEGSESVLEQPAVRNIAERHGRSAAQVVLRWGVQRGTSVIPKSTRLERLRENLDIFGFALTEEEMSAIAQLDQHRRFNDPGVFCEKAFNTFYPIYE